jgi:hypothetical protein
VVTLEEAFLTYSAAWSETDEGKRRTLLEKAWTENGIYSDPSGEVAGREALIQHIGAYLQQFPGNRTLLTSGLDEHHRRFRCTWVIVGPDGSRVLEGIDFVEAGPDNRLVRITGFFGPPPPLPSTWPSDLVLHD